MGFSISWMAFRGVTKEKVLEKLSFHDRGNLDPTNEAPFSIAQLPNGWTVVFSNDFDYGSAEHLIAVSSGTEVIACQVEEHVMYSASHCCTDRKPVWSVWHDGQKGVWDISTLGEVPAELSAINMRLFAQQTKAGGSRAVVDYSFDIPIDLAFAITGYRHDHLKFDWGQPKFTIIERVR
jgi:hypothetical protein